MTTLRTLVGVILGSALRLVLSLAGVLVTFVIFPKTQFDFIWLLGIFYLPSVLAGIILGRTQSIGLNLLSVSVCPILAIVLFIFLNTNNVDIPYLLLPIFSCIFCGAGFDFARSDSGTNILSKGVDAG